MQAESRSLYVLKSFADKPVFINFVFFLRKERRVDNIEIQKFISKKADLLFALSWKSDAPTTAEVSEDNDGVFSLKIVAFWFNSTLMKQNTELLLVILLLIFSDYYAVMPPLEQFMDIPTMDRRELFFRDMERGDIVIGRISSIREFGFFIVLICLGSGIMRDISHLEITVSYSPFSYLIVFDKNVISVQKLYLFIQL